MGTYDVARAIVAARIDELEARARYYDFLTRNEAAALAAGSYRSAIRALKVRMQIMCEDDGILVAEKYLNED